MVPAAYGQALSLADPASTSGILPVASDVIDSTSLLAWWKFEEGSGSSVADSSGSGHTLSLSGLGFGAGKLGSYSLAATATSGQYADAGDGWAEDVGALSVALFFKPSGSNLNKGLVGKRDGTGDSWFVNIANPGENIFTRVYNAASSANGVGTTAVNNTSTWYHIAMIYNGTDVRCYVNGSQEGTIGTLTGNVRNTTATVRCAWTLSDGLEPQGLLDDVRIYARALTPTEVSTLASQ